RSSAPAIGITNVPPTVTLPASYSGTAAAAINFAATVTDPSPTDTAAGFTYLWNFGDNTTSTAAQPSHTYTAAGNYTVTVTATDKDGGAATATAAVAVAGPLQATFTGNPVNEGSPGLGTFSGVAGGSGGY